MPVFSCKGVYLAITGSYGIHCLVYWKSAKLFPIKMAPFYITISDVLEFQCVFYLNNTCYFLFLKIIVIVVPGKWYLIRVLICISQWTKEIELSFHMLVSQLYIFLGEMSIQDPCSFFLKRPLLILKLDSFFFFSHHWAVRTLLSLYIYLILGP